MQRRIPTLSLGTVYKNLDALKAIGAVADVNSLHEEARYEAALPGTGAGKPHHHLICISCKKVIKAGEKKNGPAAKGVFKDLPPRLPALMFAEAVWKQIEKKSLPSDGLVDGAQVKALGQHLDEATLGRMLFEIAAAARAKGLDPEGALRLHATQVMRDVEERVSTAAR